jgi:hypothetical protein
MLLLIPLIDQVILGHHHVSKWLFLRNKFSRFHLLKRKCGKPFQKKLAAYEYRTVNDESAAFVTAIYRSILLYSARTLRQDVLARRFHFEMASSKPSAFTSA